MQIHPPLALAPHAYPSTALSAAAAATPPREAAADQLATCLLPTFLNAGHDVASASAEALRAADALLACVSGGHVDFIELDVAFIHHAATLGKPALDILKSYASGIASFRLPYTAKHVPDYDPASLARNLNQCAPELRGFEVPAPHGTCVTLDLRGFDGPMRPQIRIPHDSACSLVVLLAKGTGVPSVDSFHLGGGDPMAIRASRFIWTEGDRAVASMKIGKTAYHHTISKTGDAAVDDKRQQLAVGLTLNGAVAYEGTSTPIVCGPIVMHVLERLLFAALDRDLNTLERVDGRHPALEGMDSAAGLARTIPFATSLSSDAFWRPGGWTPVLSHFLGMALAAFMRDDTVGSERFFAIWTPGSDPSKSTHAMAVRVRMKGSSADPVYSVLVYDPNLTATWGRMICRSLAELDAVSLASFVRKGWLGGYVNPDAPVCVIKEWRAARPQPQLGDLVPPSMHGTREYLWAASLAGPGHFVSTLRRLIDRCAARGPKLSQLNPVVQRNSLLANAMWWNDAAAARAQTETVMTAVRLPESLRATAALLFTREIVRCHRDATVGAFALQPMVSVLGTDKMVDLVDESGRSETTRRALLLEMRSLCGEGIPPGDTKRASTTSVDVWQVEDAVSPFLPRGDRKESVPPAQIVAGYADESAVERCWKLLHALRLKVLAHEPHPFRIADLQRLAYAQDKVTHYEATGEIREFDPRPGESMYLRRWTEQLHDLELEITREFMNHEQQVVNPGGASVASDREDDVEADEPDSALEQAP